MFFCSFGIKKCDRKIFFNSKSKFDVRMLLIQIFKKLLNVLSISDDKNASYMVTKKNVD